MFKGEKGDNIVKQAWNWSTVHSSWNIVKTNCQLLLDCGFLSYCTQHLSHILILSTDFSHPPNRAFYVFWVYGIFFPPSTKTDVNRDVASLHWHKTTTNFTYYYISAWMELAGRQVKTPEQFGSERLVEWERNDSFCVLPAVITSVCSWAKHLTSSIQLHWTLISKLCMTTLL